MYMKICSTHLNSIHIVYHSWTQLRVSAFKLQTKNVVMVYGSPNWRKIASKSDTNQEFLCFPSIKIGLCFLWGGWFCSSVIHLVFEFLDPFKRNSFVKNGIAYKWEIYRIKGMKEGVCGCTRVCPRIFEIRTQQVKWFSYWKPSGLLIDNKTLIFSKITSTKLFPMYLLSHLASALPPFLFRLFY